MDRKDENTKPTKFHTLHIHRPRISAETLIKLFTLKSQLMGTRLDLVKEQEQFEANNS